MDVEQLDRTRTSQILGNHSTPLNESLNNMIDHDKLKILVEQLYSTVNELESMFPGRHFTPDGHMVGSLGECLVADAYNLKLMPASNLGYDALSETDVQIEIKATQAKSVAFRSQPQHAIIIKIYPDGSFEEIFNGPGELIWIKFEGKSKPTNGQYQISISKLREINEGVTDADRVPRAI